MRKSLSTVALTPLATLFLGSMAPAQNINVDFGDPMSAAGSAIIFASGAANQSGAWNHFGASVSFVGTLNNTAGNPTSAFSSLSSPMGLGDFESDNPLTSGNDESLLDDLMDLDSVTMNINGLENGTYELYTYCWAPDAPTTNFTTVLASPAPYDPAVDVGGADWTGTYIEGEQYAFHRLRVRDGVVIISLAQLPGSFGSCNGFQLKKVADEFENSCTGDQGPLTFCTPCPCLNDAPAGTNGGCLNSSGQSSELVGWGVPSVSNDTVNFTGRRVQPSSFAILVSGASVAPTNPSNPCFGAPSGVQSALLDGLRCAVQSVRRHGTRTSDSLGQVSPGWGDVARPVGGLAANGGFAAGETRHFQLFYRDDPTLGCGNGLNTSQAVTVEWMP